ncbi:U32 family peptidase [Marinobacterium aestuariivivens]|uniref:Ubiquinone biosynthesis protein UbiV n=1 Tax=Marinobacterium aestuariivivens TaxID=1698799 RepID=A0ABW2A3L0_9GAMM
MYFWPRRQVFEFYEAMSDAPVDIVYLGETVCAKRRELRLKDWLELAERLANAGKEVVLSTQALLEAESELLALERICGQGRFRVEANDMAAVQLLSGRGVDFVTGPSINIYNLATLERLHRAGMRRWVMPVELGARTLEQLLQQARDAGLDEGLETEVFGYGRLPLAYAARCFTARYRNLPKDNCGFCCIDYPDGLTMRSQEEGLFTINGIQTLSHAHYNLEHQLGAMDRIGVDILRLSPQQQGLETVIRRFRQRLDGGEPAGIALVDADSCNGYWYGEPGMKLVSV